MVINTSATGAPAITGTAQVGQTLTATVGTIADVDGLPNPFLTDGDTSFQWIRVATDNTETNIASATASTYTLVDADLGTTIKVKVSFTDDASNAETLTSAETAAVAAAAAPTEVPAGWNLKPTGLTTGDKFRLLFLSSTKRDGSSTDIADYNTFVQGLAAAGHADIQAYSTGFRAVGCTSDTSTPATIPPPPTPPPTRASPSTGSTAPRPPTSTRISTTGPGTTRSTTRTSPAPTAPIPPRASQLPRHRLQPRRHRGVLR